MAKRVVSASDFKQRCLALLDRVEETGEEIIVTKHGRAVARVVPLEEPEPSKSLRGSVTFARDDDLLSTDEDWDADRPTG
jgi:prevent-host-death family protein